MKKFIIYISAFIAALLIINFVLLQIIQSIYRDEYEKYISGFDGYIFADSHGLSLHDETEAFGVYNSSAGSESYTDMLQKVKYVIHDKKPRFLLISADDHLLSPYRESLNNKDRAIFFASVSDYKNPYSYFKERILQYWIILLNPKACLILKEYFSDTLKEKILGKKAKNGKKSKKERSWVELSPEERIGSAIKRSNIQFVGESISGPLSGDLQSILLICKKENIKVAGIKFPLTRDYINAIDSRGVNVDSIFKSNGIPVYDFRTFYQDSTHYFKDQDHLNEKGGKEFTTLLNDSVISKLR